MASEMKRREVERRLRAADCTIKSDKGPHTKWACPCGSHSANIPRHTTISPGVVADTIKRMTCLSKGWLQ